MDDFTVLAAGDTFDNELQSRSKVLLDSAEMHFPEHSDINDRIKCQALPSESSVRSAHPLPGKGAFCIHLYQLSPLEMSKI